MKFNRHIAAIFHATYLAWGSYAISVGEAESWMPAILIIPAVAILALYGVGGHWIRVAGLFIGLLVVVAGIGEIFIFGYFLLQYSTTEWSFMLWGLVMVAAGVLTFFSVRHGSSRLSL